MADLSVPFRLREQPMWGRSAVGQVLNPDELIMQQILGQTASVDAARAAAQGDTRRRILEALSAQPKALGPGPSYIPSSGVPFEAGPVGSTGVAAPAAAAAVPSSNLPVLYQGPATVAVDAIETAAPAAARSSLFGQLFNKGAWTAGERATGRLGWLSYGPNATAAEGAAIGRFAPGTLGRAGLYGLAGQIAANVSQKAWNDPNSGADNALATGLAGAGLGAGVGSIVPGVGTAIGAAIGGAGGAIYGALRAGHRDKDYAKAQTQGSTKLNELMGQLGLAADTQTELRQQYAIQSVLAKQSEDPVAAQKAIMSQMMTVLPQVAQQEASTKKAAQEAIATQAVIAKFMAPYLENVKTNADIEGGYYQKAADAAATPELRNALALRGQLARSSGAQSAAAWASAAQTAPMYAVSQQTGASPSTIAQLLAQG